MAGGLDTLAEALQQQGFRAVDEFGVFVTYERTDDPLKVHVGPDASFAAFNSDDELVAEGKGTRDLYAMLVSRPVIASRGSARRDCRG